MKKLMFASVMVMATLSLASAPALRAQDADKITIKDPAEFNAYQSAVNNNDPKQKAMEIEGFLTAYPQSVVKNAVLEDLIAAYQQQGDMDKTLGAATRLLQLDPNNNKAIFISVFIKKAQCGKTQDAQTCDDAAALARKGLSAAKPKDMSDDDWKKQTSQTFPLFHSVLAIQAIVSKKDFSAAIEEYRQELMLYPVEATKGGPGLSDTLQLAQAYTKLAKPDMPNAVWFYARALNFAPASFKPQIEKQLTYWYKKFHGGLDGLDDIKAQTAENLFPAGGQPVMKAAKTPAEFAHDVVADATNDDLLKLNLSDKEFILANGTKEDADKLWVVMKDQTTPVPGVVLEATAEVIKLTVSDDAKAAKAADFIVNLKKALEEKDIPAVGTEFKTSGTTLVGTYDSFTQIAATDNTVATVQIFLREGEIQAEKAAKKPVAGKPAPKPAAGRPAGAAARPAHK